MAPHFPDEVIERVLEHALTIPAEAIFTPTQRSTFFSTGDSNESNLLLVCRRWNRIGIPFLYEAAIIRTNSQAVSLWKTFRTYSSRSKLLRRLRIEAGWSTISLSKIVAASKDGIHTLYVGLDLIPTGDIPVLEGLPELKIQSLGLDMNRESLASSMRLDLFEALSISITQWSPILVSLTLYAILFYSVYFMGARRILNQKYFTFFNSKSLHDNNLCWFLQTCTHLERIQVTHVWNVEALLAVCRIQRLRHVSFSSVQCRFMPASNICGAPELAEELKIQGYNVSVSESGEWYCGRGLFATFRPPLTTPPGSLLVV